MVVLTYNSTYTYKITLLELFAINYTWNLLLHSFNDWQSVIWSTTMNAFYKRNNYEFHNKKFRLFWDFNTVYYLSIGQKYTCIYWKSTDIKFTVAKATHSTKLIFKKSILVEEITVLHTIKQYGSTV